MQRSFAEVLAAATAIRTGTTASLDDYALKKCLYCRQKTWHWTVFWQLLVSGAPREYAWILTTTKPQHPLFTSLCANPTCPSSQSRPDRFSTYFHWMLQELRNLELLPPSS